jgi:hypothetical protein
VATAIRPATAETLRPELSEFPRAEFIAAFERNDLGVFAMFIEARPQNQIRSAQAPHRDEQPILVIERKKSGQCE